MHIYNRCDVVMKELMQRLGHEIPQWMLKRLAKVTLSPGAEGESVLELRGLEKGTQGQTIPASLFKKVQFLPPAPLELQRLTAEPFRFVIPTSAVKKKEYAVVRLHFRGHYGEPNLDLLYDLGMHEINYTMLFDPIQKKWTVEDDLILEQEDNDGDMKDEDKKE